MATGPLVFLPGLTGSRLSLVSTSFGITAGDVWLNPDRLIGGGMRLMRLPIPSEGDPPDLLPLRGGPPLSAYYGLLMTYLMVRGWSVSYPNLDWRQSTSTLAGVVADSLRSAGRLTPCRVLCHSRGGILCRAALGLLASSGHLSRVSRVMCLGTPHTGSLNAVAALGCWLGAKTSLIRLGQYAPPFLRRNLSREVIENAVRSWPSVYELLPAPNASWLQAGQAAQCYDPAIYADSPARPVPLYLTRGWNAWIDLPVVPDAVDWIDVAGLGVDTYVGFSAGANPAVKGNLHFDTEGDGVVPRASAQHPARRKVTTPTSHAALPFDGRLWPTIHRGLSDGLAADVHLPGDVLDIG